MLLSSFFNVIYIVLAIFAILALSGLFGKGREEKIHSINPRNVKIADLNEPDPAGNDTFNTYVAGAAFYCDKTDLRCFVGFVYFDHEDEAPRVYRNDLLMMGHIPRERIDDYRRWCPGSRTYPCVGYVLPGASPGKLNTELKVIKPYNPAYVEREARDFVNWVIMKHGKEVDVRPNTYAPILQKKKKKLTDFEDD